MATKKPQKKTKKAAPRKVGFKAFNLDIRTREQAETLIGYLQQLEMSAGWSLLKQIMEGNMATLERSIITKLDPATKTMLSETQLDELRGKHAVFGEVLEKPKQLIEAFRKQHAMGMPTYDPYHKDFEQMRRESKADAAEDSAGVLGD